MESFSFFNRAFSWKIITLYWYASNDKNNDATELCITKGQEGFVVEWNVYNGPYNKPILDTLFVQLDKPAKSIKFDGLPENVVPIIKATKTIKCTYQSELEEYIERQQVWVLLNFSMTDYASQGKKDYLILLT